ncbi:MAG TPA: hypothetical protein VGR35_08150 [Tepidisphaeraceae bacterium]|nr:hypothetical protein [Tepidisphaeraceae bacterium]
MKTVILWGLVVLNVLLLAAFVGRLSGSDAAMAQARGRSDYLLIPASIAEDASSAVVYMLDTDNNILGGMTFDDSRKELLTMQPLDIERIFKTGEGVTTGTGNNREGTSRNRGRVNEPGQRRND